MFVFFFLTSDSFMELTFTMLSLEIGMLVLSVQKSKPFNVFIRYFSKVIRKMKEN